MIRALALSSNKSVKTCSFEVTKEHILHAGNIIVVIEIKDRKKLVEDALELFTNRLGISDESAEVLRTYIRPAAIAMMEGKPLPKNAGRPAKPDETEARLLIKYYSALQEICTSGTVDLEVSARLSNAYDNLRRRNYEGELEGYAHVQASRRRLRPASRAKNKAL